MKHFELKCRKKMKTIFPKQLVNKMLNIAVVGELIGELPRELGKKQKKLENKNNKIIPLTKFKRKVRIKYD